MNMLRKAKRINSVAMKVIFSLDLQEILLPRRFVESSTIWEVESLTSLSVCFQKGGKLASTSEILVDREKLLSQFAYERDEMIPIRIQQTIDLPITMYQDKKTGQFLEKKSFIILRKLFTDYPGKSSSSSCRQIGSSISSHGGIGKYCLPLHEIFQKMDYSALVDSKEMKITFDIQNGIVLSFTLKAFVGTTTDIITTDSSDNLSVISDLTDVSALGANFRVNQSHSPPLIQPLLGITTTALMKTGNNHHIGHNSPWKSPKRIVSWPGHDEKKTNNNQKKTNDVHNSVSVFSLMMSSSSSSPGKIYNSSFVIFLF
jgi:hypothetical protein